MLKVQTGWRKVDDEETEVQLQNKWTIMSQLETYTEQKEYCINGNRKK